MRRLILFLLCLSCFGAARTASVTGNWSSTATWGGSAVPGNGDTITINTGITVTVDTNETVGASPADCTGTQAIQNNSGTLAISTGVKLTLRGGAILSGTAQLTEAADSILEFDSSAASSPSTTHYCLQVSGANFNTPVVTLTGSGFSHPAVIQSNTGGGTGSLTDGGFVDGGMVHANYFKFLRLGTSSTYAWAFLPWTAGDTYSLQNGTCDTCGEMHQGGFNHTLDITFKNVTWVNSVGTYNVYVLDDTTPVTNFKIDGCVLDKPFSALVDNLTITNSWLDSLDGGWAAAQGPWVSFTNNILYGAVGGVQPFGDMSNSYYLAHAAASNPHYIIDVGPGYGYTLDGIIFEDLGTNPTGDDISLTTGTDPVTVQNVLKLPNAAGESTGTFTSLAGNSGTKISYDKSTGFLGGSYDSSGFRYGESYAGIAGMVTSFRSNLVWDTTARGWKFLCSPTGMDCTGAVSDIVAGANADYNGGSSSQFLPGISGKGYEAPFTVAPGAHDLDADPGFVDRNRNFAAYDAVCGGPGTAADAITQFMARNSASWNPCFDPAKLINWVKQGFAPQVVKFAMAGHDGGRIGAIQPVAIMGAVAQ